MSNAQARSSPPGPVQVRAQFPVFAALLGLGYLLFYGWLLARSGGFPYVMDNNESFSSLWHAINLDRFGFASGYGLTDEAYGASPAAHPYIYTHQGNFPRLPAYLLYVLGARSIDAQILVTTFTAGLAAMFMAYRFLGELTANRAFAALACAVLFSDYILVAQWQVVTYRVWHGFFFFATLLCVHRIEGARPWRWSLLLLANTVCLFYFEFVFAAFLAACAGLYALYRNPHRPGRVALVVAALAGGGAIGVGVLCAQIVLQLGWDNFVQDAAYTFVSRNRFVDSAALLKALRAFYESNHIVFWYNLFDASGFRTPMHLGASVIYYELQPHTPYFVMLLLIPSAGYLLPRFAAFVRRTREGHGVGAWQSAVLRWSESLLGLAAGLVLPVLFVGAHLVHRALHGAFGAVQAAGLALALPLIVLAFVRSRAHGAPVDRIVAVSSAALLFGTLPSVFEYSYWVWTQVGYLTWPVKAFAGSYFALLLWNFHLASIRPARGGEASLRRRAFEACGFALTTFVLALMLVASPFALGWRPTGSWLRLADAGLAAVAAGLAYVAFARLTGTREPGWRGWMVPGPEGYAALDRAWRFNIVLVGMLVAQSLMFNQVYQPVWQALGEVVLAEPVLRVLMILSVVLAHALLQARVDGESLLPRVGIFLLAGYLAYITVYILTPGYVFTGYRFRLTPLTVFLTDVVIACGLWLVLKATLSIAAQLRLHRGWGIALGSLPLLFWCQLQYAQVSLMPPEQFAVFKTLASPPYKGASFVSNTYAAPVAAFTQQWAYIDAVLAKAEIEERDGRLRLRTDYSYVWLADRETNKDYARPQYFICIVPQSLPSLTAKLLSERGEGEPYKGCADMGIVRYAKQGRRDVLPRAELIAIDQEGRRTFGHETWAIVKLDWGP